jgi:hypothetical protein
MEESMPVSVEPSIVGNLENGILYIYIYIYIYSAIFLGLDTINV